MRPCYSGGNCSERERDMKYMMTWWERPGGSVADYEAAQKRLLDIF